MTGKADFNAEEWELVLSAPPSAGLIVATAQRGGTFRESFSIAKAYTEARRQHSDSELLDQIVSAKPEMDVKRYSSKEELEQGMLQKIRDAVALVEQKATPEETEAYRRFIVQLAERVAEAHKEGLLGLSGERVSEAEREAIQKIGEAAGIPRSAGPKTG
jgi:dihydroxyacetone kinase-like predicted kinase